MKKKLVVSFLVLASFFMLVGFMAPSIASAQAFKDCTVFGDDKLSALLCKIGFLINAVIPILISLGVVYFIWGVIQYAIARDEEMKAEGRGAMIHGLIALLVIVSIWGLVNFMKKFIGLGSDNKENEITVPCVPAPSLGVFCDNG
ncbi:MAG: hypothetical protein KBD14_00870 [Candidatus Pacebacteria bacterium]|nr:hypothetical protein [Candidatus Paceibacterota bacterium]